MLKYEVLKYLENSDGFLSGSKISSFLGVSRNAVWKAVKQLEDEGYCFEKSTRLGYKLIGETSELSQYGIRKYLSGDFVREVEVLDEVSSTNTYLMERGSKGEKEGLLVVAKRQTGGKGRRGRHFHSPEGGLYFSLLLRPKKDYEGTSYLTVMTAVSVMDAIREILHLPVGIKWVNDIYLDGKKCAGILTEATVDFETGGVAYAVVGVGINLNAKIESFPKEIRDIACAISGENTYDCKNRLVATVVNKLVENLAYFNYDKGAIIEKYRKGSVLIGKRVNVIREEGGQIARVSGITDEGHLLVVYDDGREEELYFGEVSLCLKD